MTIAITISSAEKPSNGTLAWCFGVTGLEEVVAEVVVPPKFTTDRAVLESGMPLVLLNTSAGVPDCTPLVCTPPTLDPAVDCGVCVVDWLADLVVVFSWGTIQTIVKQSRER